MGCIPLESILLLHFFPFKTKKSTLTANLYMNGRYVYWINGELNNCYLHDLYVWRGEKKWIILLIHLVHIQWNDNFQSKVVIFTYSVVD